VSHHQPTGPGLRGRCVPAPVLSFLQDPLGVTRAVGMRPVIGASYPCTCSVDTEIDTSSGLALGGFCLLFFNLLELFL